MLSFFKLIFILKKLERLKFNSLDVIHLIHTL